MILRVVVTAKANADAIEAFRWKANSSVEAAERWLAGLEMAISELNRLPERHPIAEEESERFGIPLRQMIYGKKPQTYRLIFSIEGDEVVLHYIRHTARGPIDLEEGSAAEGKVFTHDVLYARASPDEVEDRGAITRDQALELFRSFPFGPELAKRARNPDLTVPTITFTDEASSSCFAVWSEVPGVYVIWLPSAVTLANGTTDSGGIEECISLFFAGRFDEVVQRVTELCAKSGGT